MQVKKLTSLFLALLLLVSNFGLAFNVHYCGDKIASFSSAFATIETQGNSDFDKDRCCCVKEENLQDSCCKDKVVDLKKDTKDVIIKTFSFQIDVPFTLVKPSELHFAIAEVKTSNTVLTDYFCSPNAPPLFKLYQQFIFYA
jgi:hypothetical protein